jgi:anti-sigma B factor antagonist
LQTGIVQDGTKATLFLHGRLDDQGAAHLISHFGLLSTGSWREVRLDLGGVTFVGSTAIGRLLRLHEVLTQRGARLTLVKVPSSILDLFSTLKLDRVLTLDRA